MPELSLKNKAIYDAMMAQRNSRSADLERPCVKDMSASGNGLNKLGDCPKVALIRRFRTCALAPRSRESHRARKRVWTIRISCTWIE